MRSFVRPVLVALLVLTAMSTSLKAQVLPLNLALDSWFGIEYLVGRQDLRHTFTSVVPFQELRTQWDPRLAVLAGTVEVTPVPFASGRIGGSVTVAGNSVEVIRNSADVDRATGLSRFLSRGQLRSNYSSWEAAGLYHLWNEGGYRFSVTGGYRRESWLYKADLTGIFHPEDATLRDEFVTSMPFLGLQTAMHFPWWKARFEVLGSWFVTKTFQQNLDQNSGMEVRKGLGDEGGVLMFTMEGSCHVTPNVLVGLQGQYSYQEFRGRSTVTSTFADPAGTHYRFYLNENLGAVGINLTVVF